MAEIETTVEMLACQEAIRKLGECGWYIEDEDSNHGLRLMWMAGRDWARGQAAATSSGEGSSAMASNCPTNVKCPGCQDCW